MAKFYFGIFQRPVGRNKPVVRQLQRRGRLIHFSFENFAKYLIFKAACSRDNWRNWFSRSSFDDYADSIKIQIRANLQLKFDRACVKKAREPSLPSTATNWR